MAQVRLSTQERLTDHGTDAINLPISTSAALSRRSLSIFSRRGTDTPDPFSPISKHHSMPRPLPKLLSGRRSNKQSSNSLPAPPRSSSLREEQPQGTILNAVPQARTFFLTNDDQDSLLLSSDTNLRTVKESSPLDLAGVTASQQALLIQSKTALQKSNTLPLLTGRPQSDDSKASSTRIGVWVDGVVHWEESNKTSSSTNSTDREMFFRKETGFTPLRPQTSPLPHEKKPSLTVIIPNGEPLLSDKALSTLLLPKTQPVVVPVTLPDVVVPVIAPPTQQAPTMFPSRDVSPLDSDSASSRSVPPPTHIVNQSIFSPLDESAAAAAAAGTADAEANASRSSSSAGSSSAKDETESIYSARSSLTSIEAAQTTPPKRKTRSRFNKSASTMFSIANPAAAGVFDDYTPITKSYVNKPLPPVPPMDQTHLMEKVQHKAINAGISKRKSTKSTAGSARSRNTIRPPALPTSIKHMKSQSRLDRFDAEFMRTSPYMGADGSPEPHSPTLSQAEDELQEHLEKIPDHTDKDYAAQTQGKEASEAVGLGIISKFPRPPSAEPVVVFQSASSHRRNDSVSTVMQPPSRAPTIPKKSRKREWRQSGSQADSQDHAHIVTQLLEPPKSIERRRSDPSILSPTSPVNDAPPVDFWSKPGIRRSISSVALPKTLAYERMMACLDIPIPVPKPFTIDDGLVVVSGPVVLRPQVKSVSGRSTNTRAAADAAEDVLLHILASLTSLDDLANTVLINKGMYRVYKENEMKLVKDVTYNQSPAAWEFREWRPHSSEAEDDADGDSLSLVEVTPLSYMRAYKSDLTIVDEMKEMILAQCQSFIRKDTAAALADPNHARASQFNDAFWRIWSFCTVFGSQKGRDEDLTGQLDWLKGGRLANNLVCQATVNTNFDFDASSILLNAPDHFGRGNLDGLTADQLYDITELWTCMAALLQGYLGRVEQARAHGVYQHCDVSSDDIDREEHLLEEWIAYVLTLGPTVVLELAEYAPDSSSAGFLLAKERGWTSWAPPMQTASRATFLKEPVTRLYEERMAAASSKAQNPRDQEQKESTRRRIAGLAVEIRLRRQDSAFKRLPLIDMSMERPMSIMSTMSGGTGLLTPRFPPPPPFAPSPQLTAVHPALRNNSVASTVASVSSVAPSVNPPSITSPKMTPQVTPQMTPQMTPKIPQLAPGPVHGPPGPSGPQLTPATPWSARRISPIAEERNVGAGIAPPRSSAESINRAALRTLNGLAECTAEIAVQRIVAMGFTPAQAKQALRVTDTGDGLRIDRAVDLLLRG